MSDPAARKAIRKKLRAELPTLLKLYRADKYLLNKLVASGYAFLEEVRADPEHPIRAEFDRFVADLIGQLTTSPDYTAKLEKLKEDILAYPKLGDLARDMWDGFWRLAERNVSDPDSIVNAHLQTMLMEVGRKLAGDPAMCAEINRGMTAITEKFVEDNKSGVSAFVADQVKSWDMDQLVRLIEINIGSDLQYIRFNGAAIGGLGRARSLYRGDIAQAVAIRRPLQRDGLTRRKRTSVTPVTSDPHAGWHPPPHGSHRSKGETPCWKPSSFGSSCSLWPHRT
jgi:uncharacterized membrane-anchored protein YjiN (DUF445 family)